MLQYIERLVRVGVNSFARKYRNRLDFFCLLCLQRFRQQLHRRQYPTGLLLPPLSLALYVPLPIQPALSGQRQLAPLRVFQLPPDVLLLLMQCAWLYVRVCMWPCLWVASKRNAYVHTWVYSLQCVFEHLSAPLSVSGLSTESILDILLST